MSEKLNEKKILNEEKRILEEEKVLLKSLNSRVGRLAVAIERARVDEYTSMITRPWKFFLINFAAGMLRGLGMAIGFTVIAAIVIYFLVTILMAMIDLPIIGMYIGELVKIVNQYLEKGIPTQ
jgi:hypothetical protein